MSYHRGGQAGAVAVSYSTSPMAPHSPSRRYSSGTTGTTTTSGIGSSTSKFSTYRSSSSSSSSASSSMRSNYVSEYRRPYCPTGSFYSSATTGIRRSYVSEYSRSHCSPARSVSSSAYGDSAAGSGHITVNGTATTGRYGSTSFGSSGISSRDRTTESLSSFSSRHVETPGSLASAVADTISRYSPAGYVPNIRHSSSGGSSSSSTSGTHHWKHHHASSLSELFGGDEREVDRRERPESSLSSSSSSSSAATGGLWSRSKRRPAASTVLTAVGHARADGGASPAEVTIDERSATREDVEDGNEDGNVGDDQHNNNNHNSNNNNNKNNNEACAGFGINNNRDENDEDEDEDVDNDDDDNDNRNSRYLHHHHHHHHHRHHLHHRHQQQQYHQRDGGRRPDENVSPGKRNLLSPSADAGGGGGGGGGLIGVSLDPLTNLATNPNNAEPLIGNNGQDKLLPRAVDGDIEIEESEVIGRGDVVSVDAIATSLQGRNEILKDGDENERNASTSSYDDIDEIELAGPAIPCVLQNGVTAGPSGTHGDDPSVPTTSRRSDSHFSGGTSAASNLTSSPAAPSTAHQSLYRGVNDQFEGSPTSRSARNRLQAHRDERCGLNGLRNIGNTCFMNSVIQCLSNTRPLLEYLLNEEHLADINTTTSSMKGALIKAFSQVIHELWEVGGDHVVNTTALKCQIQRFAPRFMGHSQQDAQEFLRYLLEGLHEDVNRVTVKPQPIHTDIPDMYTDSQKAVESWKRYLRSEDSMIVDVFVGQLRSSLHCTSCDHVSVTLDPFWDLSLPIPARSGTVKLSQCLEHFTREEVLDGDEKPTCSKCQMRRKCTKSFSIQKFPKILVIHLKRFSPMERFRGKLNVMVDFPLTGLDLSAFAAPRVPGCTYNLYGVANHSGTTYSGHYTAYCKHPYSGEWHEYNDSRVSEVSARSVVSSEAYVLFYEQQPHSSHL